jgi:formate dehydrogenase subunit gamma
MTTERVERFKMSARVAHWGHTVTFLVLLVTGLTLYSNWFAFLIPVFGGREGAQLLHRIFAIGYTVIPIACLIANPGGFIRWMKDLIRWSWNDIKFLMGFPLEFFGFRVKIPPQGQFNGGEKMNSIVTGTSCVLLAISGYMLWFPQYFPVGLVRAAYPMHDICMILATTMVCMHAYLGSFHPGSGESFWGMWKGTVRVDWAAHHHASWFREITGQEVDWSSHRQYPWQRLGIGRK